MNGDFTQNIQSGNSAAQLRRKTAVSATIDVKRRKQTTGILSFGIGADPSDGGPFKVRGDLSPSPSTANVIASGRPNIEQLCQEDLFKGARHPFSCHSLVQLCRFYVATVYDGEEREPIRSSPRNIQ